MINPISSPRGFSVVKVIIIILGIAVLSAGGYFIYQNFFSTQSSLAKMIPEELRPYAVGKDANVFIIVRNSSDAISLLKIFPGMEKIGDFKSALFIAKKQGPTAALIMNFSNIDSPKQLKKYIDNQIANINSRETEKYHAEVRDKIVIFSYGDGTGGFDGQLVENPAFLSLDKNMANSQIVAYLDNYNTPEITVLVSAIVKKLINTDLLSLAKQTYLYAGYKDSNIKCNFLMDLMSLEQLASSPLMSSLKSTDKVSPLNLNNLNSQEIQKQIDTVKLGIQKQIDDIKGKVPGLVLNFDISEKNIMVDVTVPAATISMLTTPLVLGAPQKSRDAARKADLNNLVIGIEQYYATSLKYPQQSACADQLADLKPYFKDGKFPADPAGAQTFGDIKCDSGYYYQYLKKDTTESYALWAKMEGKNGNTNLTPNELEKTLSSGGDIPQLISDGNYYVLDMMGILVSPGSNSLVKLETTTQETSTQDYLLYDDFAVDARPTKDPTGTAIDYSAVPGQTISDSIFLQSLSKISGTATVYAADRSDEKFAKMKNINDPNTGVGLWTTLDKSEVTLSPGQKETINFSIKIPEGTPPGTYLGYLITAYTEGSSQTKTGIRLTLTVSGSASTGQTQVHRVKRNTTTPSS